MRMQRRLRNLDDDNDVVGGKQCAYFSGRRNNEAGYIEDAIIKDAEGCLKELPYTCVLYLPDKGLYENIGVIWPSTRTETIGLQKYTVLENR